jgi:hypothetical protein
MQQTYVGQRLVAEFAGTFSQETVMECVRDTAKRWVNAPVQTFVDLLTERFARESLRAAANAA